MITVNTNGKSHTGEFYQYGEDIMVRVKGISINGAKRWQELFSPITERYVSGGHLEAGERLEDLCELEEEVPFFISADGFVLAYVGKLDQLPLTDLGKWHLAWEILEEAEEAAGVMTMAEELAKKAGMKRVTGVNDYIEVIEIEAEAQERQAREHPEVEEYIAFGQFLRELVTELKPLNMKRPNPLRERHFSELKD